jgi:hypothetical protein
MNVQLVPCPEDFLVATTHFAAMERIWFKVVEFGWRAVIAFGYGW